jgi:glutamyl-tRNA reductase
MSKHREVPKCDFERLLYDITGHEAIRHVFRVVSSLDSMVVGESQILGQMKQFFTIAQQEKSIGAAVGSIMERAFMVAKKVRSETTIGKNAVSVSSVAVELASKIFGKLDGKTALIVGAGKMSLLTIQYLQNHGVKLILVANRTYERASELASQINGRALSMVDLAKSLDEADIVLSSTGSSTFLITKEHVLQAMGLRKNRPMFFIDIAVPRDIDPKINEIGNVFLYDIDDLKIVADQNRKEREKEAQKAEELVQKEADVFWTRLKAFDVAPTIREIHARIEALRRKEIEMTLKKLDSVTPEQKEAIEQLTSSMTNKILQSSFAELKNLSNQPDGLEKIELIKKLFRLKE